MLDKITRMLKTYRERLQKATDTDNLAEALQFQGAIVVLELLYIYAMQEKE